MEKQKGNKRLIIHIGMPKTGSSSIQRFLKISRGQLFHFGIKYPKNLDLHNLTFFPLFFDNPFDYLDLKTFYPTEEAAKIKNEEYKKLWQLEFRANNYNDIVISSENLYFSREKQVKKIYEFTKGIFKEIRILCYIRDPKSFMRSWIQQGIKGGMIYDEDMNKVINNISSMAKYSKHLKSWIKFFGADSLTLINFNQNLLYKGDIVRDFFFQLGYEDYADNIKEIIDENVSLNSSIISFLYHFNRKYPAFKNGKVNNQRGLLRNKDYYPKILRRVESDKEKNEIILSDPLKEELNKEIEFVNSYLSQGTRISLLDLDENKINDFKLKEVELDLCIDIVNECFKEIEAFRNHYIKNSKEYRPQKNNLGKNRRNQVIRNLNIKPDPRDNIIQNLKSRLDKSEQEVLYYALSKSWRITRPLRKLTKLFKVKKDA